jgi:hypothetical protein
LFQTGKGFRQKGASLFLTYHYVRNKGTKKESSQTATSMSRTLSGEPMARAVVQKLSSIGWIANSMDCGMQPGKVDGVSVSGSIAMVR